MNKRFYTEWESQDPARLIKLANGISKGKLLLGPSNATEDWARRAMLQEHSTLEWCHIIIVSQERSDVCSHAVRHTKGHPRYVVESQRPDWTGKERPGPESERLFGGIWTPYSLIQMARQRLCASAMKETREMVEALKEQLAKGDPLMKALSWAMVPECAYRGGCVYDKGCGRMPKKDLAWYGGIK